MKIKHLLLSLAAVLFMLHAQAQAPAAAADVMAKAFKQAAKEKKNVFLMFHASWCGWCHKMDASMNEPELKAFFDDNYVIEHLVVFESKDKVALENPGALEMLKKYKDDDQGIPMWMIFDKDGKLLADSKIRPEGATFDDKGENVGCPAAEKEVAFFLNILKKTSKLKEPALQAISTRFRQNEVKPVAKPPVKTD